ncbi:AMP-binding protein [Phormidium tenue FACHB-886]|nr:AMP-binding protein [Phormidium tenue FACHB-886]
MVCPEKTSQVLPGNVILGRTLPSLLHESCTDALNTHAFNQWTEAGWRSLSNQAFQTAIEALAAGLLNLGLEKGDRVALLMHSDVNFCIADFGSLLANLVNVPIDLTQTLEHIIFVLQQCEAKALIISNLDLLTQVAPYLWNTPHLQHIIVITVSPNWQETRSQWINLPSKSQQVGTKAIPESIGLDIPMLLHPAHLEQPQSVFPQCIQIFSLNEIQQKGQSSTVNLQNLYAALTANQLATIVYVPDEAGQPQGVMLTHENLSANALAAFAAISDLKRGAQEAVLSFLPLNHVLARTLLYGHIYYGHSIYFSNPNRVVKHLKEVCPTVLTTVPLFLEKIYSKILERGSKAPSIAERVLLHWAIGLAKQYELGVQPQRSYAVRLRLADRLVFSQWRSLFGNRLQHLICGGAALRAEIATVFAAAGIPILQGYGLTQTSAVVCCNRTSLNRVGTVGIPIPGVEISIAADGEILVRGPYVTPGYYKNSEATQALIDPQGWLHTGDLGAVTEEGFLKITGLKKALFKLSTGKYIVPQPIEQRLKQSPFVAEAIAVGADQKFCAMLIMPNLSALHSYALEIGLDLPHDALLKHPCVLALYQALVNIANCHLPYWATVKRFRLLSDAMLEERSLTLSQSSSQFLNRSEILKALSSEIDALFKEDTTRKDKGTTQHTEEITSVSACPNLPVATCPVVAQSLNPRLTTLRSIAPFMLYTGMTMPYFHTGIPG